ncbi:uncharacterized protein LOC111644102 [Copidosoma floridanum]|uniref:uncharacterized protein LOC111644102 n=1 Tax=Copidosoma floridanum TaxID=29053 RepID=UPI000C6F7C55|nr:uncharacterized protein LOC111644102 [Copidosoma floridanum]
MNVVKSSPMTMAARRHARPVNIRARLPVPPVHTVARACRLPNYAQLPVGGGGAVLVLSELESMAARQQREIAQQRRLLEQREARLAVLRGAQARLFRSNDSI